MVTCENEVLCCFLFLNCHRYCKAQVLVKSNRKQIIFHTPSCMHGSLCKHVLLAQSQNAYKELQLQSSCHILLALHSCIECLRLFAEEQVLKGLTFLQACTITVIVSQYTFKTLKICTMFLSSFSKKSSTILYHKHHLLIGYAEIWENKNCCGNMSQQASVSTAFSISSKLPLFKCFQSLIETQRTCFLIS